MCSCGRRCSSVLFKKRGTCKIPSVHSASHLLPALGLVYSSVNPPSRGVNSQDPRALSPLATPRLRGTTRSIPGTRLPWIAFRAYCSDRGPGSGHPGASIFRYWPGIPPPLSYCTSLSGFPPLWLKPEPFMSAQAFRLNRPKPESGAADAGSSFAVERSRA